MKRQQGPGQYVSTSLQIATCQFFATSAKPTYVVVVTPSCSLKQRSESDDVASAARTVHVLLSVHFVQAGAVHVLLPY